MAKQPEPLGPVQLEILKYIADHQPVRVSVVAEHFAATAGKARTTILTVMVRLREKGYLTRKKRQGTYHYALRHRQSDVLAGVVQRFVEKSLGGSVSPFIAYLADAHGLSDAELEKLKDLVQDVEARRENEKGNHRP